MKNKYIEEIINNSKYVYYAHTKEDSDERELLSSHLNLTYLYYKKMEQYKNLEKKIKNIIEKSFKTREEVTQKIYEIYKSAIYYHDIGKINPLFQKNKMKNDLNVEIKNNDDTHAALSASMYIDCIQKEIEEESFSFKEKVILKYITYYFGYIISRHHTELDGISNLEEVIKSREIIGIYKSQDEKNKMQLFKLKDFIERINPDPIGVYILCKMLYSSIITADFYATYEYISGKKIDVDINKNNSLFENYKESELIKNIRKYEKNNQEIKDINKVRNDIFLETEKNLIENIENDIFYIEAPTGSGKTNIAINVAKILYENNKDIKSIQYIFPFNTIIEQTALTFENYFDKYKDYIVINSTTSMVKDINENLDYNAEYIKNIFRQYSITITSHVNLFNTLFGSGKEANYSLYHFVDSVIVIDEIQSYSNNIWRQIIEMFNKYSNLLNIKFVIMSATLPRLDKLLKKDISNFYSLIKNKEKYYENKIFKDRVKLNFELLNKKIDIDSLIKEILKEKGKKVLVECIKKDTANKLYEKLIEKTDNVHILTSDENKYMRDEIIKKINNEKALILVSTQTIEAGVDIDMDIGFKDISFIDSEEQFLGRINRSSKKKDCIAYFFDLDDARNIYKGDNRLEYSLEKSNVREWLENKKFDEFYEKVMNKIYSKTEKYNNENIENFYNNCQFINYKEIKKTMNLINSNTIQLFLNYSIKIDDKILNGKEIFYKYMETCKNKKIGYAEKKIKLSKLSEKFNIFIYSIYKNKLNLIEGEEIGNIYYIEDGEKYMKNGRFNKEKYLSEGDGLFL